MDIETLASYRELARRLARDIDDLVERRRATLALLELNGASDTRKARHVLNVSEELQRKIWSDNEQVETEFQELLKCQDGGSQEHPG